MTRPFWILGHRFATEPFITSSYTNLKSLHCFLIPGQHKPFKAIHNASYIFALIFYYGLHSFPEMGPWLTCRKFSVYSPSSPTGKMMGNNSELEPGRCCWSEESCWSKGNNVLIRRPLIATFLCLEHILFPFKCIWNCNGWIHFRLYLTLSSCPFSVLSSLSSTVV